MNDMTRDGESLPAKTKRLGGADRRGYLRTALGSGFTAAAIHTDSAGLTAGTVTIDVDGQQVPVYRAQPEGQRNLPVVLVVSEALGAREHLAEAARRFARLGYLALAPDLRARQGGPSSGAARADAQVMADLADAQVLAALADAQVLADLDATVAWARANGGNPGKIAITGLGGGDRITWLYAAHNPSIKAGAAWYSRPKGGAHVVPGGLSLALAL